MRKLFPVFLLCILAVGIASADQYVTVNFPDNNAFFCSQTNGCGTLGANGGQTLPMWTAGDFVTETFYTGQASVSDLFAGWGVVNDYGGNPGAVYEDDVYINGVFVAYFDLTDCNYCGTLLTVTGGVDFAPIVGYGTYNITIVLDSTAGSGFGSQWFSSTNAAGGPSTAVLSSVPEPGSLLLLGSGVLGLAGVVSRKLSL